MVSKKIRSRDKLVNKHRSGSKDGPKSSQISQNAADENLAPNPIATHTLVKQPAPLAVEESPASIDGIKKEQGHLYVGIPRRRVRTTIEELMQGVSPHIHDRREQVPWLGEGSTNIVFFNLLMTVELIGPVADYAEAHPEFMPHAHAKNLRRRLENALKFLRDCPVTKTETRAGKSRATPSVEVPTMFRKILAQASSAVPTTLLQNGTMVYGHLMCLYEMGSKLRNIGRSMAGSGCKDETVVRGLTCIGSLLECFHDALTVVSEAQVWQLRQASCEAFTCGETFVRQIWVETPDFFGGYNEWIQTAAKSSTFMPALKLYLQERTPLVEARNRNMTATAKTISSAPVCARTYSETIARILPNSSGNSALSEIAPANTDTIDSTAVFEEEGIQKEIDEIHEPSDVHEEVAGQIADGSSAAPAAALVEISPRDAAVPEQQQRVPEALEDVPAAVHGEEEDVEVAEEEQEEVDQPEENAATSFEVEGLRVPVHEFEEPVADVAEEADGQVAEEVEEIAPETTASLEMEVEVPEEVLDFLAMFAAGEEEHISISGTVNNHVPEPVGEGEAQVQVQEVQENAAAEVSNGAMEETHVPAEAPGPAAVEALVPGTTPSEEEEEEEVEVVVMNSSEGSVDEVPFGQEEAALEAEVGHAVSSGDSSREERVPCERTESLLIRGMRAVGNAIATVAAVVKTAWGLVRKLLGRRQ